MANDRRIPDYVFEDLLFQQRLRFSLRIEQERMNKLLQQQIELVKRREEVLCELTRAMRELWNEEQNTAPDLTVAPASETEATHE
jgi:hypothetical protein